MTIYVLDFPLSLGKRRKSLEKVLVAVMTHKNNPDESVGVGFWLGEHS
jgi:hypothetical protein